MIKKEIVAKLTELGIEFDPKAKASELEALLPEGVSGEPTPAVVEGYHVVEGEDTAAVYNGSLLVRTYSEEVHGSEYLELAEEFVKKNSSK